MVHIGDSRLLRGDTGHDRPLLRAIPGRYRPDHAREVIFNRNVVLKILGDAQADVAPDETIREGPVVGDRWMLCSDGVSARLPGRQ